MCNLEQIIDKCKKGDNMAAGKLYNMFSAKMFAICLRYARDRMEAEDTLQDGFIKVFDSIKQYNGKGSFEGWMKRIFINMSLEKFRKEQPIQLMEELPDTEDTDIDEEVQIPANVLQQFIQELPEKYKMVFNLYVLEEMPHKDIAVRLGITEGTSKSNLARARDILKRKIKVAVISFCFPFYLMIPNRRRWGYFCIRGII